MNCEIVFIIGREILSVNRNEGIFWFCLWEFGEIFLEKGLSVW